VILLKSRIQPIYHSSKEDTWTGINWSNVEKTIKNLQHRITKATELGNYRKVRNLQRLLTKRSFSASLKAVRFVAQQNSCKKTPEIYKQDWTTPKLKLKAALELRKKSDFKQLKKMSLLNLDERLRGFRLPSISDCAHQVLYHMAILPCVEAFNHSLSYDLRPSRHCWKANAHIRALLNKRSSPQWVLNASIEKCMDQINTKDGTTQIDVISQTLSNFNLNGLENYLKEKINLGNTKLQKINKSKRDTSLNIVSYGNEFIVTGRSQSQLECVKKMINEFLAPRGFQINKNKTKISHISQGFDFLGWTFRKYLNNKFLCQISKESIIKHRKEIKYLTKTNQQPEILINKLNQKIKEWMNYHRCANNIWKVWNSMNQYLYKRLMKWGLRRHGKKTSRWIFNKYWKCINKRWSFTFTTNFIKCNSKNENLTYKLVNYDFQRIELRTIEGMDVR
jgi:RNA-directed DNA polymerase